MYNGNMQNQNKSKNALQSAKMKSEPLQEATYVQRADKVIREMKEERVNLTTSQIRNILSMVNQIYNEVMMQPAEQNLSEAIQGKLRYLKIKIIYAAGRTKEVKIFVEKSQIAELLEEIQNSREAFILYAHYIEALVAYHRFYGGKE